MDIDPRIGEGIAGTLYTYLNNFVKFCFILGVMILTYLFTWRIVNKKKKYSSMRKNAIILVTVSPIIKVLLVLMIIVLNNMF